MAAPNGLTRRSGRGIVVVDLVESVRHFERDEVGTAARWHAVVGEVERTLPAFGGRLAKSLGDGLLLEFDATRAAVACALRMPAFLEAASGGNAPPERFAVRVGVHTADIFVDDRDIYGAGVNLCARLASLAGPGEIVASAQVRDLLVDSLDADVQDLGECFLKHVAGSVRAFRLTPATDRRVVVQPALPSFDAEPLQPAIAVLPLRLASGNAGRAIMGRILADEVNAALSVGHDLAVISRMSVDALADRDIDPATCRSLLGAHYVLGGSIRCAGDRLVVLPELVETRSGRVLWSESLRGRIDEMLAGDGELVHQLVAHARAAVLLNEVERSRFQPLPTLESYALLMGGVALLHRASRADFQRAHLLLDALRERHAQQSSLHAWIAKWHVLNVAQGWSPDPVDDSLRAQDAARRAIDLDDRNSVALAIDGLVNTSLLKRLDVGMQRYEAAVEANANDGLAWALKGTLHAFRGEARAAVHGTRRALQLSPLDPLRYFYETLAATAELSARNWDEVIALATQSLRRNRTHTSTWRSLAIAQAESGRLEAARATVTELMRLDPSFTIERYRQWTPSVDFETGSRWAAALSRAGVPQR
jgi:class 3 adenylate cyclase/TolB-like protein